jgi:hypothetical protein
MQKIKVTYAVILMTVFMFLNSTIGYSKKYTIVIEPTYPVKQGKEIYEALRQWLGKKTGHEFELIIDNNYYFYWRNANGSRMPDFTFDAPHVAAYRAKKKNYTPIAVTIEDLSYHLIALNEPKKGESIQDFLVGKRIIMLPSPSLASVFFNQWFTDLFARPDKDVTALSWQEAVEIVFDDSAQAAIVPNWMYNLYPNFASLKESEQLPGTTFMASPNVSKKVVDSIQKALISLVDDEASYDVLVELNTQGFKKPKIEDYDKLMNLLPGVF